MTGEVLHTEHLAVGYRGHAIIGDFSITLKAGEFVGLKGLNGSGKTTLLKTLGGLYSPISGEVFIQGKNLHELEISSRAALVSMVLTERTRLRGLNVRDLVEMGRYPAQGSMHFQASDEKDFIDRCLEKMNITHLSAKSLTEISDGELQKTMIARALAQATPLIIMDEPTAFLDYVAREEFYKLMSSLCSETGLTVLFSSHDVEHMDKWAGRIIQIG